MASSSVEAGQPDGAGSAEPAGPAVLFGRFRHVGGAGDLARREAAVDAAVEEMSFLIREVARERLREKMSPIAPELSIEREGEQVEVDIAGKVTFAAPLDGEPVDFSPPGRDETVKLSFAMRGPKLVQTMQGDRGGTRRVYAPEPGGTLSVEVTVFGERLPKSIEYVLHYELDEGSETHAQ